VIGNNKNDQTAEGALIGGAVGAVTGGLIGHHRDKVIAEQQRQQQAYYNSYYSNRTYPAASPRSNSQYRYPATTRPTYVAPGQPTIVYGAPVVSRYGVYRPPVRPAPAQVRQPVSMQGVIHMTRNGVSDAVIVSHIQANGVATRPSIDDVIVLSQEGVSDYVITAMQNSDGVEVIVEPSTANPSPFPIEPTARDVELLPVPPLRTQRRGF
jgi:hypothetical protein